MVGVLPTTTGQQLVETPALVHYSLTTGNSSNGNTRAFPQTSMCLVIFSLHYFTHERVKTT